MLFSLEWLLALCPADADARHVADALTARGLTVDSVNGDGELAVLDVDIPANRPDCLGHRGLARELSAATGTPLRAADPSLPGAGAPTSERIEVRIDDPDLCQRYTAGWVEDVRVGPSPAAVVSRLERCGLRSINNVVDASNLVLLELGHPIHFFDADKLRGVEAGRAPCIHVRRARPGERLTTLDGIERELRPEMLVIADGGAAVALAGVIGGADTEIGESTRRVLIEAARFEPTSIRGTSRRLAAQTDASYRFERGVDVEGLGAAQALAARLLGELAEGRPAPGLIDVYPRPHVPRQLVLRASMLRRLLGYEPDAAAASAALNALGLSPQAGPQPSSWRVSVPSYRRDLEREADLVEEVARHVGYDRIPVEIELRDSATSPDAATRMEERARDVLANHGFHEAVGYAMIGPGQDEGFAPPEMPAPLRLTNPIAEPMSVLRRSVLPGLLRAADRNLRRGTRDVRLFEIGRVFHPTSGKGSFPHEALQAALVWSGAPAPRHWSSEPRDTDLFDVIGVVEFLMQSLRPGLDTRREAGSVLAALHPGRSASWTGPAGVHLARAGALHPEQQRDYDFPIWLAEIELDGLAGLEASVPQHAPVPRVPAVTRDLSLIVEQTVDYASVVAVLRSVEAPAPASFAVLDRYEGKQVGAGKTSLTVRATLQPLEQTLTDEVTEAYRGALVGALRDELGVDIRS